MILLDLDLFHSFLSFFFFFNAPDGIMLVGKMVSCWTLICFGAESKPLVISIFLF